ncbi:hypothetical protein [Roseimaritima ulvae]|uniref:hypothetical protein n=1 Tax=Roseimaritima ulvae TaxID=980254 RepID=UPI00082A6208|nr:hypothetical protein [Roseimaritima ulvae]
MPPIKLGAGIASNSLPACFAARLGSSEAIAGAGDAYGLAAAGCGGDAGGTFGEGGTLTDGGSLEAGEAAGDEGDSVGEVTVGSAGAAGAGCLFAKNPKSMPPLDWGCEVEAVATKEKSGGPLAGAEGMGGDAAPGAGVGGGVSGGAAAGG